MVNGVTVNNIRYAYDTVLIVVSSEDLQDTVSEDAMPWACE